MLRPMVEMARCPEKQPEFSGLRQAAQHGAPAWKARTAQLGCPSPRIPCFPQVSPQPSANG